MVYESNVNMIDSVEATDSHTLVVKTKNPYPLLLRRLSGVAIVSKSNVEGSTTEDFASGKVAIGTGPYKFVGNSEMASKLYCFLKASQSLIPAILANAYH